MNNDNKNIEQLQALSKLLAIEPNQLQEMATEHGVTDKRQRKLSWSQFLLIHIMSILEKGSRHIDRVMIAESNFDIHVGEKTMSDRLMKIPASFLFRLISLMQQNIYRSIPSENRQSALKISRLLVEDATILKLSDLLAPQFGHYPGSKIVAAKIYLLIDAFTNEIEALDISKGNTSDLNHDLKAANYQENTLELRDRGWYGSPYYKRMVEAGRYFIMRTKSTFNPVIDKVQKGDPLWEGKKLKNIKLPDNGEIHFRFYPLKKSVKTKVKLSAGDYLYLDVIGKKVEGVWHFLICYLKEDWNFTFDELFDIYRYRWNIEVLFKELKSGLSLTKTRLTNEKSIINHICLIVIAYLIMLRTVKIFATAHKRRWEGISKYRMMQGSLHHEFVTLLWDWINSATIWRLTDWQIRSGPLFKLLYHANYGKCRRNRNLRAALAP